MNNERGMTDAEKAAMIVAMTDELWGLPLEDGRKLVRKLSGKEHDYYDPPKDCHAFSFPDGSAISFPHGQGVKTWASLDDWLEWVQNKEHQDC